MPEIPQELLDAAWYLHAVASVNQARERYTAARQRQAFLVSAHIFDLALNQDGLAADQTGSRSASRPRSATGAVVATRTPPRS